MVSLELMNLLKIKGYSGINSIPDILLWFKSKNYYVDIAVIANNEEFAGYIGRCYFNDFNSRFETNLYQTYSDALESLLFDIQNYIYD